MGAQTRPSRAAYERLRRRQVEGPTAVGPNLLSPTRSEDPLTNIDPVARLKQNVGRASVRD